MTSGTRKPPPISTSSPRETIDLASARERGEHQQRRGGVVVDDHRGLGAGQPAEQRSAWTSRAAARPAREVVFEVACSRRRARAMRSTAAAAAARGRDSCGRSTPVALITRRSDGADAARRAGRRRRASIGGSPRRPARDLASAPGGATRPPPRRAARRRSGLAAVARFERAHAGTLPQLLDRRDDRTSWLHACDARQRRTGYSFRYHRTFARALTHFAPMTRSTSDPRQHAPVPSVPDYRPVERFWPYVDLPEQPTAEELAALDPELARGAVRDAAAAVFDHARVSARSRADYARAVAMARASAEYREIGSGDALRHRARFYPQDALAAARSVRDGRPVRRHARCWSTIGRSRTRASCGCRCVWFLIR